MSDSAAVHSADFFGPLRDRWWNADYLALLARRCGISEPVGVLDVGCGQGHWTQALAHVLPAGSTVLGIDREEESLADKDTTRRYWLAGDGDSARFESLWRELMTDLDRCIDDIAGGRWSAAGGALMYVVSARKPVY